MYNELKLVKIETANYTLIFKHKYSIQVKKEGDQYSAEDSALSMFVSGNTLEEVKREIDSEFKFMWDHIASEAEENLSEGARKVKTWLLENIVVEKR